MMTNPNKSWTIFRPSFGIYRADGSKQPTLKRSFIVKMDISLFNVKLGYVTLNDGTSWILTVEPEAVDLIDLNGSAFCIVSFQAHEHGNYAVARHFSPKKQASSYYATDRRKQ